MAKSKASLKLLRNNPQDTFNQKTIELKDTLAIERMATQVFRMNGLMIEAITKLIDNDSRVENKSDALDQWHFIPMRNPLDLLNIVYSIGLHENTVDRRMSGMARTEHNEYTGRELRFLDVGCGIGNICGLVNRLKVGNLTFLAYGIEYMTEYAEVARRFATDVKVVDALEYDKYRQFDVIYFYWPIRNSQKQKKLEKKIKDDMNIGAYLIAVADVDGASTRIDKRFVRVKTNTDLMMQVYKKIEE